MELYKDIDKDSNIDKYEIGDSYIKIQFKDGSVYVYTYNSAMVKHVEEMKKLAQIGEGLNAYINKHKPKYSEKTKSNFKD